MLSIRAVQPEERPLLYAMVQDFWQTSGNRVSRVQDPALRAQFFEERYGPESRQWWAILNDERIGFCNVTLHDHPIVKRWGYIDNFYIVPKWQRQGHGRTLAHYVIEWLKQEGATSVDLNCRTNNPTALAFWQAMGFEIVTHRLRQTF